MQLPLLSNLLGLGAPPAAVPPGAATEHGAGFAQLLASLPVPAPVPAPVPVPVPAPVPSPLPVTVPEVFLALPAVPLIAVGGVPASLPVADRSDQKAEIAPVPPRRLTAKPAATGKDMPRAVKLLPDLLFAQAMQPVAAAEVLETPTTEPAEVQPTADEAESVPVLLPADLAFLPNPVPFPPLPASAQALPAERQLTAAAALTLPLAAPIERTRRDCETLGSQLATLAPHEAENGPPPASPPLTAAIPLARIHSERPPREIVPAELSAPLPPPLQPANPQPTAPASPVNTEAPAAPEIELGQIIERLVENRIHARETRSEVKLAHPDFGRVTLALNLAGQDRLGLTMPDGPAELRTAVGQAFAPPNRSEPAPPAAAADTAFTSSSDARSQDTRRDQQSSGNRADQSRGNTDAAHNRQFTTSRDNGPKASGRGVLA